MHARCLPHKTGRTLQMLSMEVYCSRGKVDPQWGSLGAVNILETKHRAARTFFSSDTTLVVVSRPPNRYHIASARRPSSEVRNRCSRFASERWVSTFQNVANRVPNHLGTTLVFQTTLLYYHKQKCSKWVYGWIPQQARILWFESFDFSFNVRVHRTMNS